MQRIFRPGPDTKLSVHFPTYQTGDVPQLSLSSMLFYQALLTVFTDKTRHKASTGRFRMDPKLSSRSHNFAYMIIMPPVRPFARDPNTHLTSALLPLRTPRSSTTCFMYAGRLEDSDCASLHSPLFGNLTRRPKLLIFSILQLQHTSLISSSISGACAQQLETLIAVCMRLEASKSWTVRY